MRFFFALWPDEDLLARLAPHRLEIARVCGGRPTTPVTLHMTLNYVGPVSEPLMDELLAIGEAVTVTPFDYTIDVAACFGRAGVAWLAADRTPQSLIDLQSQISAASSAAKFATDPRPFRPHLTVVRNISRPVEPWHVTPVKWTIDRFSLIGARTDEKGVHYDVVREWAL
jgi:RNA 2',3'-cyclic 3'-phosphodiesterase